MKGKTSIPLGNFRKGQGFFHLETLEIEKERIEQSIMSMKRVIKLLDEEGEVDSTVLLNLIHHTQAEHSQKE